MTINVSTESTADESYGPPPNPAWCSVCQQMINRRGLDYFPHHYFPDTTVIIECEGSGWTPDDVDQMVRERRPVPGRYVRPHP